MVTSDAGVVTNICRRNDGTDCSDTSSCLEASVSSTRTIKVSVESNSVTPLSMERYEKMANVSMTTIVPKRMRDVNFFLHGMSVGSSILISLESTDRFRT